MVKALERDPVMTTVKLSESSSKLFRLAFGLSVFTIIYNIAEGIIAMSFGYTDESLTLFGFGADSFIETISGFGILHMVTRIQANPGGNRDSYERTALRITGFCFYALAAILVLTSIYNFVRGQQPETTFWGLIISLISIIIMWALVVWKTKVGRGLNSEAIIADAECTKVCIYMSVVLLLSSGLYYFFGLPYADNIGALVLAYLSLREGRECFEKARSDKYCACKHD